MHSKHWPFWVLSLLRIYNISFDAPRLALQHGMFALLIKSRKVVSQDITVSHLLSINNILKRRVIIWDNLNANDYDQRRLCMGPYTGRSLNISNEINGILLNPNCEFELNFIPLNTLGQWFKLININEKDNNYNKDFIKTSSIYEVNKAFEKSLIDWLPEFNKIKSANDSQQILKIDNYREGMSPKCLISSLTNEENVEESLNENVISCSSSRLSKSDIMECDHNKNNICLTIDDIRLLVELFYLPYQHGPNIQQVFMDFYWLRFNYNQYKNVRKTEKRKISSYNSYYSSAGHHGGT
ncbi:unnamed protein product, partial [Rotaria sp. Silwood1]